MCEWDSNAWITEYNRNEDVLYRKNLRKDVFNNTCEIVENSSYVVNGKTNYISSKKIRKMQETSRFYSKEFSVSDIHVNYEPTVITVENEDSLIAGKTLVEEGYKVALLNMANGFKPGGGIFSGSGAQEENLLRRTTLYKSLFMFGNKAPDFGIKESNYQFPLNENFGGVYSPNVFVFRGLESEGYPLLEHPYSLSIISVPGVKRPELTNDGMLNDYDCALTKNKIRTILRIGLRKHNDALVLGALGCGSFRNPPNHIALLFKEIINEEEFKNKYKKIVFAIIGKPNFDAFKEVFEEQVNNVNIKSGPILSSNLERSVPHLPIFLFDFDGVIRTSGVGLLSQIIEKFKEVMREKGCTEEFFERTSSRVLREGKIGVANYFLGICNDDYQLYDEVLKEAISRVDLSTIKRDDHLMELLEKASKKYDIYILTNNFKYQVDKCFEHLFGNGIDHFPFIKCFDITETFRDGCFHSKKDPKCFEIVCERIGAEPNECTLFDDTIDCLTVANRCSLKTVYINKRNTLASYLEQIL